MADGGASIDSACGWPSVSNIDPCRLPPAENANWIIDVGETRDVDTDAPRGGTATNLPSDAAASVMPQLDSAGSNVLIIHVKSLVVRGTLRITGRKPLVLVADETILVTGSMTVEPLQFGTTSPDCGAQGNGTGGPGGKGATGVTSGGGAGAGFGALGGAGGNNGLNQLGGLGGSTSGNASLVPLRSGCQGGNGGDEGSGESFGGRGGGAIQLAARTRVTISGRMSARGRGGEGAIGKGGGAGGGAGGAILIESEKVDLGGARLCANGGGGGAVVVSSPAHPGEDGKCIDEVAFGGTGAAGGGNGGTATAGAARGADGDSAVGGGGGGGGVGRLRVTGELVGVPLLASPPVSLSTNARLVTE